MGDKQASAIAGSTLSGAINIFGLGEVLERLRKAAEVFGEADFKGEGDRPILAILGVEAPPSSLKNPWENAPHKENVRQMKIALIGCDMERPYQSDPTRAEPARCRENAS